MTVSEYKICARQLSTFEAAVSCARFSQRYSPNEEKTFTSDAQTLPSLKAHEAFTTSHNHAHDPHVFG